MGRTDSGRPVFLVVSLGIALPLLKCDFTISPLLVSASLGRRSCSARSRAQVSAALRRDRLDRKRVFIADMTIIGIAGGIGAAALDPWSSWMHSSYLAWASGANRSNGRSCRPRQGVTALIAIEHPEIAERLSDIQMFGTVHFFVDRQASFQDRFRCG